MREVVFAEFTSRQVKAIENNPLIAEAMRETLIDPRSSVNRRMQNFKQTAFAQPSNVSLETDGEMGGVHFQDAVSECCFIIYNVARFVI